MTTTIAARMTKPARSLLLVDDESAILSALKRELRSAGYELLTATSGEEALRILANSDVQVILSDYRMPGMSGVELLTEAHRLQPDAVRMVLSGYADIEAITEAINCGRIYKFLNKPWNSEQLQEVVADAFAHHDLVRKDALFSRIFENTTQGIFIVGADACIDSVNPAFNTITTSVGIAIFPEHGTNAQDLMKHADLAMYATKENGRNGYRIYDASLAD
jgi:DNA-binding NtrC family response regulator